jgi:hypothetical protein
LFQILVPKGSAATGQGSDGDGGEEPTTTAKVWGSKESVATASKALLEVVLKYQERNKQDKGRKLARQQQQQQARAKQEEVAAAAAAVKESSGGEGVDNDDKAGAQEDKNDNGDEAEISFEGNDDDDEEEETKLSPPGLAPKGGPGAGWDTEATAATTLSPPGIAAAPGWS